jgi:hypothetical protein
MKVSARQPPSIKGVGGGEGLCSAHVTGRACTTLKFAADRCAATNVSAEECRNR